MKNKRIVIAGATSGLGRRVAEMFVADGHTLGVCGRNEDKLLELQALAPDRIFIKKIDITSYDAPVRLRELIGRMGGMDIYFHSSGILADETDLNSASQISTINTNTTGFSVMVAEAYRYFQGSNTKGQIAAISSIAGFRGLAELPAYCASKAFDSTYLEALRQRAHAADLHLKITDIKPGWTRTPLLDSERHYLLEMDEEVVARKIYRAIMKGKNTAIIGWRWKILTFFERLLPTGVWTRLHLPLWK